MCNSFPWWLDYLTRPPCKSVSCSLVLTAFGIVRGRNCQGKKLSLEFKFAFPWWLIMLSTFFIGHFYVFFDEISFLLFFFLLFGMFVLFHTVHGVLKARILKWFAIPFSSRTKLWKILQEMGIPDHLTCLLRNLYAGQEVTVRSGHGTTDWFK